MGKFSRLDRMTMLLTCTPLKKDTPLLELARFVPEMVAVMLLLPLPLHEANLTPVKSSSWNNHA
jgi:hypothetical protein